MKKIKRLSFKKVIIFFIFVAAVIYSFNNFYAKPENKEKSNSIISILNIKDDSTYKTIKQDTNSKYSGIGQKKVKDKDGYFTTFTTVDDNKKTYLEYKQNGNSSWNNNEYWGGSMSENGCGITAIATILSGYNKDFTPEDLRKKYFPVLDGEKISRELSKTFDIKNTDFYFSSIDFSKNALKKHLETNRPVLICVWNKPNENRWTSSSHYMVLLATDGDDMVYVSNPNGGENNSKSSGWYSFDEVVPYIAKALYIEDYK